MNPRRRHFLAAAALSPLVLAGACSSPLPLARVGGNPWIGYAPLFLARDLGLYDDDTLRLVEMPSNTANLMSLATGDLEAAALTLDECLLAREGGLDVRVILAFDNSAGADVVMGRPAIERLADLKGRRIGVEATAVGALILSKTLEAAGLTPIDIVKAPVTSDRHVQAYLAGEVDALVSFEPFATQLQAQGARRLYDSSHFPGLVMDVLVARADVLEQSPASFRQLLAGYFRALDFLRTEPDAAFRLMAPRLGMSPSEVRSAQQGIRFIDLAANRRLLGGSRPDLATVAGDVAGIMMSANLLRRIPALDGLADPRFLPAAS